MTGIVALASAYLGVVVIARGWQFFRYLVETW
jgi:hypothetical protein